MRLCRKMVYLVDIIDAAKYLNEPTEIGHVTIMKGHPLAQGAIQSLLSLGGGPNETMHFVSLFQKELTKVGAILTTDACLPTISIYDS